MLGYYAAPSVLRLSFHVPMVSTTHTEMTGSFVSYLEFEASLCTIVGLEKYIVHTYTLTGQEAYLDICMITIEHEHTHTLCRI